MSSISNSFISSVNNLMGHGDRANKFQVEIGRPLYSIDSLRELPNNYTYACKATSVPTLEIGTTDIWTKGKKSNYKGYYYFSRKMDSYIL